MKTKNIKNIVLAGLTALVLGSCENKENSKYKNFANFVKDKGKFTDFYRGKKFSLVFLANNKEYHCSYDPTLLDKDINIMILADKNPFFKGDKNFRESFHDNNLNGLDYYSSFLIELGKEPVKVENSLLQSKKNENKYETLIDSIPKWYAESKKIKI